MPEVIGNMHEPWKKKGVIFPEITRLIYIDVRELYI